MSILTKIVDAVEISGLPCYLPGRAPGECRQPHAVATDGGRTREGRTTGRRMYYVTVYVPETRPADLSAAVAGAADAAVTVREIRATGDVSESFFDGDKKAYCATIEFSALCGL